MATTKLEAAKELAQLHFRVEPDLKQVFLVEPLKEDDPREPIKLLEVVDGAVERWIEPVAFPSNPGTGVPFPSVIIELSPGEFRKFQLRNFQFEMNGWKLGEELSR